MDFDDSGTRASAAATSQSNRSDVGEDEGARIPKNSRAIDFGQPDDLADVTAGLRISLEIANQSPISKYLRGLNVPTKADPSDAELTEHAKRWSQTEYHAVGTCAMGVDENAVVDPQY